MTHRARRAYAPPARTVRLPAVPGNVAVLALMAATGDELSVWLWLMAAYLYGLPGVV